MRDQSRDNAVAAEFDTNSHIAEQTRLPAIERA